MRKLKRLVVLSGIVLFAVLLFNLLGFINRNEAVKQKEMIDEAYFQATSQEVLMGQLSRKVSVLSIHHFSPEDERQQIRETIALDKRMAEQQLSLKNSFTYLPSSLVNVTLDMVAADSVLQQLHSLALATIKKGPVREEDHSLQALIHDYEARYISSVQHISNKLRASEKTVDRKLAYTGNVMFISLVFGLVLLTFILVFPAFRFNTQTYKELKRSLEETQRSRELLSQSELKYRQLFECSPLPMWIVDVDTLRFLEVNNRMEELYGYSRNELLDMTILDIRPETEMGSFQTSFATRPSYDSGVGRWVHQKKNGQRFTAEIHTHKIYYQEKEALLVIANDLTETLQLQKQLVQTKINYQRNIAKASLSVQERERNEIGKELHDNVNQILTAVKLHLELIPGSKDNLHVCKSLNGVTAAIQEIRRLSGSLVPPAFKDMGLLHAIEDLVDNMNCQEKIMIQFQHKNFKESDYSADFKLTVFRIVQEQLTNAFKHAKAKNIKVILDRGDKKLCVLVEDDGIGFEKDHKKKGVGLINIVNRADAFHGKVSIDTAPGKGCCLNVCFTTPDTEVD